MDFLIGALLILFGIFTLMKGELKLSDSKISRGKPARIAGMLMILALPIAFLVSMVVPSVMVLAGRPVNVEDPSTWERFLPIIVMLVVALVALVVAFRGTGTPPKS